MNMTWQVCDSGSTIGTTGSESGIIVLDEEHPEGARVTLERDGTTAPWSITCGIYGVFVHTAFAADEVEGREKYESMKAELIPIMREPDSQTRYLMMHTFAENF